MLYYFFHPHQRMRGFDCEDKCVNVCMSTLNYSKILLTGIINKDKYNLNDTVCFTPPLNFFFFCEVNTVCNLPC